MQELQAKQRFRKKLYSKPVFFVLLAITIITVKGAWSVYAKKGESERNLSEVAAQVESMRIREAELSAQIARLETERGIEEEIRKKFSVVKPGEELVVLVDDPGTGNDTKPAEKGFFGRMWERMKGVFGGGEESDEGQIENQEEIEE